LPVNQAGDEFNPSSAAGAYYNTPFMSPLVWLRYAFRALKLLICLDPTVIADDDIEKIRDLRHIIHAQAAAIAATPFTAQQYPN
jgi:hypothetical protein